MRLFVAKERDDLPVLDLSKSTDKSTFVAVVDTESTGLQEKDQPISIGIILYEIEMPSGILIREIGSYYGLRKPTVPISSEAQRIHGIALADLKGQRLDFYQMARLLTPAEVIVAHYASFDYRMLGKVFPIAQKSTWACSCLALSDHWAHLPNRKLDTICEALGIQREAPHNAMSDCRALAEALFTHSGKTKRSRTYMGHLVANPWMPSSQSQARA